MKSSNNKTISRVLFIFLLCIMLNVSFEQIKGASNDIQAPVLKWQQGGCYTSQWCDTGSRASPAVADLNGDGAFEVIGAATTLVSVRGEDGVLQWRSFLASQSAWTGVIVADLDANGLLEVAVSTVDVYVSVFDFAGNEIWSRNPDTNVLRGLSAYDLDADGSLEVIVTAATYNPIKRNSWVYEHNGDLRPGWPQLDGEVGYAYYVWNDNAAIGDIDVDGLGEIIVPADSHYICAYEANGEQIQANPVYGNKTWCQIGAWENLANEITNSGSCNVQDGREERHRINFGDSPATIADVNGDGILEIVIVGNVIDCAYSPPISQYMSVLILNADRSRFNADGYDWRTIPYDTGSPLVKDEVLIKRSLPNAVVADLDSDGLKEMLFASYDGRMHAIWLDKIEHHNWPYSIYNPGEGVYRFASEPVVVDLDNNGYAEVIFGSWVQSDTNLTGKLHILDYKGNVLHEVLLPPAARQPDWNGVLGAPTIANIDEDADLEVVMYTARAGLVAYDLPNTPHARVLWKTGRGNYLRNGASYTRMLNRIYLPALFREFS